MDMDLVTRAWINIDKARDVLAKEFKKADEKLAADQQKVSAMMLKFLSDNGADTAGTKYGKFEREAKIFPNPESWDKIYDFIIENNAFELLQKRLKKTFVDDYMATHNVPPPGIKMSQGEYTIKVTPAKEI